MPDNSDYRLVRTLRALRAVDPPRAGAERAVALTRQRLIDETKERFIGPTTRRHVRGWRWAGAAAALLAAMLGTVWISGELARPAMALTDVLQALDALRSIRYTTSADTGEGPTVVSHTWIRDRTLVRIEYDDGRRTIMDRGRGHILTLNPQVRRASLRLGENIGQNIFDVVDALQNHEREAKILAERDVDGIRSIGFMLTGKSHEHTIWVDAQTRLLVRWETVSQDKSGATRRVVNADFVYGEPLDAALFDLTPPADYQVERRGAAELQPFLADANLQSPTLFVGEGIGRVRFGMSLEEVEREFGKPDDVDLPVQSYKYLSRGIELFIGPGVGVWAIFCRTQGATSARIRDYSGKTDKGIGMGATAEAIIAAYGPPDKPRTGAGNETLGFKALHLDFSLSEGRLVFIQHTGGSVVGPTNP